MRRRLFPALIVFFCASGAAIAQHIRVYVQTAGGSNTLYGTFAENTAITIDLQTVSADKIVRIYDVISGPTVAPTRSAGPITIAGTLATSSNATVQVLVSPGSTTPFPTDPLDPIDNGLKSLGSVGGDALVVTDPSLRKVTEVAIALTGHLTGHVQVGRVLRIQALAGAPGDPGDWGNIDADIETTGPDYAQQHPPQNFPAIRMITAAYGISGSITAQPYDSDGGPVPTSIGEVIVGNEFPEGNDGLQADVRAVEGKIVSLRSTGPVGAANDPVLIRAKRGLTELRRVGHSSEVAPAMYASIIANDQLAAPVSTDDGAIQLLECSGDLHGDIHAANISYAGDLHNGILCSGVIYAPITVDLNLENADIIGKSLEGPISIGCKSKGAVVATDRVNGRIVSFTAGYGQNIPESWLDIYPRGMVSPGCIPYILTPDDVADEWLGPVQDFCWLGSCPDLGAYDSVLRAARIDYAKIRSMTRFGTFFADKPFVARVESPDIGTLIIDDMREGAVWSGALELQGVCPSVTVANDPSNDYAHVESLTVGCVGPAADLWIEPESIADITGDLLGEVYLDELTAGQTIRIGGKLGNQTTSGCACWDMPPLQGAICQPYTEGLLEEDSPRDTGYASVGAIRIAQAQGLHGQIIIDANNTTTAQRPTTHWLGDVVIGTASATPITLNTSQAQPYDAPLYDALPATLGGGAVGLVPFALHALASQTVDPSTGQPLLSSQFSNDWNPKAIEFELYGPGVGGPYAASTVEINLELLEGHD